jgi:hypothetical protein
MEIRRAQAPAPSSIAKRRLFEVTKQHEVDFHDEQGESEMTQQPEQCDVKVCPATGETCAHHEFCEDFGGCIVRELEPLTDDEIVGTMAGSAL